MGGVKLDVSVNWISNIQNLEKDVLSVNSRLGNLTKMFNKDYFKLDIFGKNEAELKAIKEYDKVFDSVYEKLEKLNKQGKLSHILEKMFPDTAEPGQTELTPFQLYKYATVSTEKELERIAWQQKHDEEMAKKIAKNEASAKAKLEKEKIMEDNLLDKLEMDRINEQSKEDARLYNEQQKKLKEDKKKDDEFRKKQWMLMLGKWGRLGVWGIVASQAIKYISKAVGYAYSTSMQGLDWERTIRGGASGGSWFGQGLASYGRAGIAPNQYQGFKRGIQGYLGSVKLGMGNAAPLMYLGLSALSNPDLLEKELERSLRSLPKDVSLALAGQMGLDYNMWEAIYSGRLDRQKSAYSEDAIQKWANLADSLNDLITSLKTFFFNNLAPIADFVARFLDKTVNKQSDWQRGLNLAQWWLDPVGAIGRNLGQMIRFGAVEVIVKDRNGEVIGNGESEVENTMFELG